MKNLRARFVARVTPSAEASSRAIDVIASTPSLDSEDRVVVQDWSLDRYLKNPVVLWNHGFGGGGLFGGGTDDVTLPIGYASNVAVDDEGNLRATLNFVDEKANPIAEKVYQGFLQGSLRAVSVGWNADDVTYDEASDTLVLKGNELIEISAVAIPANPDAVRESAAFVASLRAGVTNRGEREMKVSAAALLAALGASPEATEAEAIACVNTLVASKSQLNTLLASFGAESFHDAVGLAAGLKAKADQFDKVQAELDTVREERKNNEFMASFRDAELAGKIVPANRANCLAICGAAENGAGGNLETLKALVATLPVMAPRKAASTVTMRAGGNGSATDEAFKAMGITPTEYAAFQQRQASRLPEGDH